MLEDVMSRAQQVRDTLVERAGVPLTRTACRAS